MEYEPLKRRMGKIVRSSPLARRALFFALHLFFLRSWYVRRAIRRLGFSRDDAHRFLDAGSGFGQYAYFMARRYPRAKVLGLELDEALVDDGNGFIRRLHLENLRFEAADITRMDDEGAFDLILSVDVLEHIEDDEGLLRRFSRALRPGGRVILTTPSLYRAHREDSVFVEEHVREGYSEEEMRRKLAQADLIDDAIAYGYGFWGDLSWRLGVRNGMYLLRRGFCVALLAPLYFVVCFPLVFLLMVLDYVWPNRKGTGMVVVASKSAGAHA